MASPSSTSAVVAALVGNGTVALIKFVAFMLSGSAVLLSESIHSLADTGNQALLWLGMRRGNRESDDEFHYGYGGERFVFGLISAAGIFFLGCGVTIYHGIQTLISPDPVRVTIVTYVVLAAAFVIEGAVLLYAVKKAREEARGLSLWAAFKGGGMDPATLAILLEDSAAVLGVALATAAIVATSLTGNPVWDSLASIVIGVLLGAVAIFLVLENRGLLLGRAVPPEDQARFLEVLQAWPSVQHVRDVKSRQITPEVWLFKAEIAFHPEHLAARMEALMRSLPADASGPARQAMAMELSRSALMGIATEIDAIEQAIRAVIPQARHIDLELDRMRTAGVPTGTGPSLPAAG